MTDHTCSSCAGPPPTECPQCGTVIIGATAADWRDHFETECNPFGALYCFVGDNAGD